MYKKPITIIGAGQVGGLLSYQLLQKGHNIRVIDSGSKLLRQNRQIPWGWLRKFSLQSDLKKNIIEDKFPIANINVNKTNGPMLISSKKNESLLSWKEWINKNPETDSRIFNYKQASKEFDLNEEYFEGKGGLFMCDSRDYLMDFSLMNEYIWDYLYDNPNCELIENCEVKSIIKKNNIAEKILTNQGEIELEKTVLCVGNQSQLISDLKTPKLNIRLPYAFIKPIEPKNYIGLWNKYSSLSFFSNGDIKLSCGTQSSFNPKQLNYINTINFCRMGILGLPNLNLNTPDEILINKALEELEILGIKDKIKFDEIKYCDIDLTPNLCPYIYFMKESKNILNISGFSGSGSMIIDPNFINLLIDSIENEKLNSKLLEFQPANSILKYNYPPANKETPLSSII